MLHAKTLYSYNDVMIEPSVISKIKSRSECNPLKEDGKLPIFTAPMSTVVNENNFEIFEKNNINTILPRNINISTRYYYATHGKWAAFSLNEFQEHFINSYSINDTTEIWKVLIDVANGHMQQLYDLVKEAKKIHCDKICIMIGNIANPNTYFECYKAGVDYVRAGIGGGSVCISSSNVAIHYPMASLIDEVYKEKINIFRHNNFLNKKWEEMPQIIADGGIKNYSDVIKALALGSDYVMIGGLFASLIESAGDTFSKHMDGSKYFYTFDETVDYIDFLKTHPVLYKELYGMASKEGQIAINGKKTKTAEGIRKEIPVIGTIPQWSENMNAYLRSAMSYTNIRDLKDFNPENIILNVVSNNTIERINK